MNKNKKYYLIIWILLVALFNFVCFITPAETDGVSKYTSTFWSGYGFITASFVIHLIFTLCSKAASSEKQTVATSLAVISWIELAVMVAVGSATMIIPGVPYWVGSIICAVILVASIIFVMSTKIAGEPTVEANQRLNASTAMMRVMTDEAAGLLKKAENSEIKAVLKDVYEVFRYSDPITSNELQETEAEIEGKLSELRKCVIEKRELDYIKSVADELMHLIENRNLKCKALKRRV